MLKKIFISVIIFCFLLMPGLSKAASLGEELAGRILLAVESHGEAYYVSPDNFAKYYLGRPGDAYALMRMVGLGISDKDIKMIPVGFVTGSDFKIKDGDNDGIQDEIEDALKTDKASADSDNDGYNDKIELENNYDPLGANKLVMDEELITRLKGKILLQVESHGEAWYLDPVSQKRYFLGSPTLAFGIMKYFGLGISNDNLAKINAPQSQDGYIKDIYSKDNKYYMDIDYVDTFNYPEATQKAVEDGECASVLDCPIVIYYRNKNPLIRTLEIDKDVTVYLATYIVKENSQDVRLETMHKEDGTITWKRVDLNQLTEGLRSTNAQISDYYKNNIFGIVLTPNNKVLSISERMLP